jgi:hypothetical protein
MLLCALPNVWWLVATGCHSQKKRGDSSRCRGSLGVAAAAALVFFQLAWHSLCECCKWTCSMNCFSRLHASRSSLLRAHVHAALCQCLYNNIQQPMRIATWLQPAGSLYCTRAAYAASSMANCPPGGRFAGANLLQLCNILGRHALQCTQLGARHG